LDYLLVRWAYALCAYCACIGHNSPVKAFYADQFVLPLPQGHRFPMGKYRLLRDWLGQHLPGVQLLEATAATDGQLALCHTPAYIQGITTGSIEAARMREIGFPWSLPMAERARRSVGASIQAARASLGLSKNTNSVLAAADTVSMGNGVADIQPEGIAANLAGGTHHSYADKGGGFCVFNDFAVTARLMQAEWGRLHPQRPHGDHAKPLQVAIIDLDVHQGNGTASIFAHDPSVFTLSMHGEKNFPFRKEASNLDVNLPDGCQDDEYLHALDIALDELDRSFKPGLVLYLAGADPHEGDRLGRLKLTYDGLEARDRRVMHWCWQRRTPLAFAMGGGYGTDIETTLKVQQGTYGVAVEFAGKWRSLLG
jgi:acetoin utilization deacetylase AcuC-like enzyme